MTALSRILALLMAAALAGCASPRPAAGNGQDRTFRRRSRPRQTIRVPPFARSDAGVPRLAADGLRAQAGRGDGRSGQAVARRRSFVSSRIESAGLNNGRTAENVSYGVFTEEDAISQWRASPSHDQNLLMPEASRFGIAYARSKGARQRVYWAMAIATEAPRPVATLGATGPSPGPAAIMAGPSEGGRVVVRRVSRSRRAAGFEPLGAVLGAVRRLSAPMVDGPDEFARRRRNFRWRLPARFNIGVAVLRRLGDAGSRARRDPLQGAGRSAARSHLWRAEGPVRPARQCSPRGRDPPRGPRGDPAAAIARRRRRPCRRVEVGRHGAAARLGVRAGRPRLPSRGQRGARHRPRRRRRVQAPGDPAALPGPRARALHGRQRRRLRSTSRRPSPPPRPISRRSPAGPTTPR